MIKNLSNQELDMNLKRLVAGERKILYSILEHINEVDRRKLYLEKAYSSLYEYLVQECRYSGSAAMRRISAARLMHEVPVIAEKIQSGNLNLSQVSELSRAIKEKEKSGSIVPVMKKTEIVSMISGKTTEETQRKISEKLDLELKVPEKTSVQKDESVHLQITLSKEQYKKLLSCRDKAASQLLTEFQDSSLASVIEFLTEHYLDRSEIRKIDQKLSDNSQAVASTDAEGQTRVEGSKLKHKKLNNKSVDTKTSNESNVPTSKNLTLTPKTRRYILIRDGCCQYKDLATGKICGSTFNLEIDHKQSRWAGGNHSNKNLQVLCKAHNNYKYQKELNLRLC